jgi:hypothetical protein
MKTDSEAKTSAASGAESLLFKRDDFLEVASRYDLARETAEALWSELTQSTLEPVAESASANGTGLRRETEPFAQTTRLSRSVKVLLYVGTFLVIGSYGWWAHQLKVGFAGLLALSLLYAAGFLAVALYARARGLDELARAAAVIVAFYIPVVVFASLRLLGLHFGFPHEGVSAFYQWISGGWIWLELAAIAGAVVLYLKFRDPLLALPLSLFTLFLAEDGTTRALGLHKHSSIHAIGAVVLAFAGATVAIGIFLDYRGYRRHAFWPHTFGAIGGVVGLEFLLAEDSYQLALVLSGVAFLLLGVWLGRVGYLVAGGLALWVGITAYEPSPVLLTLSGLALVGVSIWLSLANSPLRRWLQKRTLPAPQRD